MSKLNRELDKMIEADDDINHVNASFFTTLEDKVLPSTSFEPKHSTPVPFIPQIDDTSVSTFGTASLIKNNWRSTVTNTTGLVTSDVTGYPK